MQDRLQPRSLPATNGRGTNNRETVRKRGQQPQSLAPSEQADPLQDLTRAAQLGKGAGRDSDCLPFREALTSAPSYLPWGWKREEHARKPQRWPPGVLNLGSRHPSCFGGGEEHCFLPSVLTQPWGVGYSGPSGRGEPHCSCLSAPLLLQGVALSPSAISGTPWASNTPTPLSIL